MKGFVLASLLIALAGSAVLLLPGVQDRLIQALLFHPAPGGSAPDRGPGATIETVALRTPDGVVLHAYEIDPGRASPAILFLHGNAGNAADRLPMGRLLAELGARVLIPDYRGYGHSRGRPSVDGLVLDARTALDHLLATGTPVEQVVVFGRSLGGAVALQMARGLPLAGVVLESTFSSLADVARSRLGAPAGWIAGNRLDSVAAIGELRAPVLVLHGDRDRIVPIELGRRLAAAAPEPKRFEVIPGAGHNDTLVVGGRSYLALLGAFLGSVTAGR